MVTRLSLNPGIGRFVDLPIVLQFRHRGFGRNVFSVVGANTATWYRRGAAIFARRPALLSGKTGADSGDLSPVVVVVEMRPEEEQSAIGGGPSSVRVPAEALGRLRR